MNIKLIIKLASTLLLRILLRVFWRLPVCGGNIMFMTNNGGYCCNPKYLYRYMAGHAARDYHYIWVLNGPEEKIPEELKDAEIVRYGTFQFFLRAITAKVIITNNGFPTQIPLRDQQILINTWHGGGAYKRCDYETNKIKRYLNQLVNQKYSIFVSSGKMFSEVMSEAEGIPKWKMLEIGMPRNDMLRHPDETLTEEIRRRLTLEGEQKLILYAPTFRGIVQKEMTAGFELDIPRFNEYLREGKNGYILGIRLHPMMRSKKQEYHNVLDLSEYDDMQELLAVADILITDYSSSMWDFSLMAKPCFILASDIDDYRKNRGFYTEPEDWPFPVAKNTEELISNINTFESAAYQKKLSQHHRQLGIKESFEAGRILSEEIERLMKEINKG